MTVKYTETVEKEIEIELPFAVKDMHQTIIATESEIIKFNDTMIVKFKNEKYAEKWYKEELAKASLRERIDLDKAYEGLEDIIESFRQIA